MSRNEAQSDGIPLLWMGGWSIDPRLHPFYPSKSSLPTEHIIPVDLSACQSPDEFVSTVVRTIARYSMEVDIAAWSFGTLLALKVRTLLGNRVRRLVLFSATPKFTRDLSTNWTTGLASRTMQSTKRRLQVDRTQALTDFHQLMLAPHWSSDAGWSPIPGDHQTPSTYHHFTRTFAPGTSPWSTQSLVAGLDVLDSFDLRDSVARTHARTLLVHGTDDRVCPVDAGRWLANRLEHAEMIEVEGAGHCPHLFLTPQAHRQVEVFLS